MRLVAIATVAVLAISPAFGKANAGSDEMKACGAQWSAMPASQKNSTTYKQFTADCMSSKTAMAGTTITAGDKFKMTPRDV